MSNFRFSITLAALSGVFLSAELVARYGLGLGTPPLYVADPLIEYRLKPSQQLRRFGNRINVNRFSMRSAPLEQQRQGVQRRVLVFGDSVVWGGTLLDQSQIATELLVKPGINEVGNVLAPSWGPGNWLGYAKRFGFFAATDVVLVISSHDAADNPSSQSFRGDVNRPLLAPPSGLIEGIQRYLLPRLGLLFARYAPPRSTTNAKAPSADPTSATDPRVRQGLNDLREFISFARASGVRLVAVQFADREEAHSSQLKPDNQWIAKVLQLESIHSIQAGPIFRSCGAINSLYTDDIHPYTAAGQACLAKAIEQALKLTIKETNASQNP